MKILLFNAYYEPELAASLYLCTNLYEDLAINGHDLELYTPLPTRGVSKEVRSEYKKRRHETKYNGKLKIHRIFIPGENKNPILRAIRYLWMNIIFIYFGLNTKADLIYLQSTPPTQGAMGAILKKIKKVPVIYDLQDIFPDSLINSGLTTKDSITFKIGKLIERFTYKNMDKIFVISEDFKRNIMDKGVPEEKIEVVYNWVDENEVIPTERNQNILFDKYDLNKNNFYISYCGNIGLSQNLNMLIEVAKELEENIEIYFLIIGDGVYKKELEKRIDESGIKNIILLPFQPYEDIAHVFSIGDVGLVISKANIGENSIPSKTWSIMSAQRPVLASFDSNSELSCIIENSGCGICAPAEDKLAFTNAILNLYKDEELRKTMGCRGREYIINNLTRKIGTGKKIALIQDAILGRNQPLDNKV